MSSPADTAQPAVPVGAPRRALHRLRESAATGVPFLPLHAAFGLRFLSAEEGAVVIRMPTSVAAEDGALAVSGLLVLVDATLGLAVSSTLPPGRGLTTVTIDLHCLDLRLPAAQGILGSGRVVHADAVSALSAGELTTTDGDPIASCSSRCILRDLPPPGETGDVGDPVRPPSTEPREPLNWREAVHPGPLTAREAVGTGVAEPAWANLHGQVQGGALAILAERTLHRLWSAGDDGRLAASPCYDLSLTYLRGVRADGREISCRARVVHEGRSLTVARAEIVDGGRPALELTASRYGRPPADRQRR